MRRALPFLALFALLLGTGCQQLFTTSLAAGLAKEPVAPTSLNASSAAVYAETLLSSKNPVLTAQVAVPALADLVAINPSPSVVADAAAITVVATGLDRAIASISQQPAVINSMLSGDFSAPAVVAAFAGALSAVTVSADAKDIFVALAAADPTELAAQGTDVSVFVIAAAALAIAEIETMAIPLADVIDGTQPYAPSPSVQSTLDLLAAGALAVSPSSQYASLLQGLLGI